MIAQLRFVHIISKGGGDCNEKMATGYRRFYWG